MNLLELSLRRGCYKTWKQKHQEQFKLFYDFPCLQFHNFRKLLLGGFSSFSHRNRLWIAFWSFQIAFSGKIISKIRNFELVYGAAAAWSGLELAWSFQYFELSKSFKVPKFVYFKNLAILYFYWFLWSAQDFIVLTKAFASHKFNELSKLLNISRLVHSLSLPKEFSASLIGTERKSSRRPKNFN